MGPEQHSEGENPDEPPWWSSKNISRRQVLKAGVKGAKVGAFMMATGGTAILVRNLTSAPEEASPIPYIENEAYLGFLRRNQVSFTLHDAAEDPKKTELAKSNPKIFRPEINVGSNYDQLYSIHNPENIEWLSIQQREKRDLKRVFEDFASAGIIRFEFDLKFGSYDFEGFMSFINFLNQLKERHIDPTISGNPEWVYKILDFENEIPNTTELLPTLTRKHEVSEYKRKVENGWGNRNSGATVKYGSSFRDEIIRFNQANDRPVKLFGVRSETELANLRSEGDTEMQGARLVIGTDDPRLIQRAIHVF